MAMDLSHHMDEAWLAEAYRRTRKDGAVGVDGESGEEYGRDLQNRLKDLLGRAKSGRYRAPPVRRAYIPKGDGTRRPLGIPAFEDKLLQRAVAMLVEPVFEQDFLDCSYGFRPGRSAHQALDALWQGLMGMGGGYVIDLDIKSYFDTVDHAHVRDLFAGRVRDGVVRRLIGKWLNAKVREGSVETKPTRGVPQGGVISPMLSNLYLHEVLDTWFHKEVQPRMRGRSFLIRYADDAVLVFEHQDDAHRVLAVLGKRFAKYGLALHPDKTRLVNFKRGFRRDTFDFLGFTHFWARSRKGKPVVKRKTSRKTFTRGLKTANEWLRSIRHWKLDHQHRALSRRLMGHRAYFGITGNSQSLSAFFHWVVYLWHKWLRTRSRHRPLTWEKFRRFLERCPLPKPTTIHSVYRPRAANE